MGKTLAEMAAEIREVNTEKGWRVVRNPWGDYVALLHSEIAEMLEAYRDWRLEDGTRPCCGKNALTGLGCPEHGLPKPQGVGSEAADVLIRLLDMADVYGLKAYDMDCELADVDPVYPGPNAPSTFGGWCAWLHTGASYFYDIPTDEPVLGVTWKLPLVLTALAGFCTRWGIDLDAEYERKIAYSRTRPYQHGGRTLADNPTDTAAIIARGEELVRRYHPSIADELGGGGNLLRCQLCPESRTYWRICPHGHVCLVNAGRLLHPLTLDVCDPGAEGGGDV